MKFLFLLASLLLLSSTATSLPTQKYRSEIKFMPGHTVRESYSLPLPHTYTPASSLPQSFSWADINGTSFVTKSLNQHLPQYCGSCWAHGAMSALADRIKIARKAQGDDINLAIQYILNCGADVAGSCYGGSASGAYQFVKESKVGIPYDTCLQYEACSADSNEGFCAHTERQCNAMNTCRTCSTFTSSGGKCVGLSSFPNATIAEYGSVTGADNMKAEIFKRGPIACGVNAAAVLHYTGGVLDVPNAGKEVDHIISIIGWGYDPKLQKQYWIIRNSWGQYWGELGYFRVVMGDNQLGLEGMCSWATPQTFSVVGTFCDEDGTGCESSMTYQDPGLAYA